MARTLRYEADIDAEPTEVWKALTDFEAYPDWNPFIRRIAGDLRVGSRLRVVFGGRLRFSISPSVVAVEPGTLFRWRGSLLGLFNGEHSFRVIPRAGGGTHFVQWEDFDGALVPLVWPLLRDPTLASFESMGEALAARTAGSRDYPAQGADPKEGQSSTI